MVLLQGGEQSQRYCTDTDDVFRQVNYTCKDLTENQAYFRGELLWIWLFTQLFSTYL